MCRQSEKKHLLNSNTYSTCFHNVVNFGSLTAEIGWWVCSTPANFNKFRVLASLLQRRLSMEISQTWYGVWPYPGLVRYIYVFWSCCSLTEFCQLQNSLCVQVAFSYCTALEQRPFSETLRRGTMNGVMELSQRAPPIYSARGHHVGHRPTF